MLNATIILKDGTKLDTETDRRTVASIIKAQCHTYENKGKHKKRQRQMFNQAEVEECRMLLQMVG